MLLISIVFTVSLCSFNIANAASVAQLFEASNLYQLWSTIHYNLEAYWQSKADFTLVSLLLPSFFYTLKFKI